MRSVSSTPTARRVICLLSCLLLGTVVGVGCGDSADQNENDDRPFSAYTTDRSTMTDQQAFFVSYAPTPDPIPVQQIFEVSVSVYESSDQQTPVTGAALSLDARMPTHGHGMNTSPEITANGDGTYSIDGMKFHMESEPENPWVLEFTVDDGNVSDTAMFKVHTSAD